MPKVSVLMPSFNYAQYLRIAVNSVLSQSYSDLEVIVTDDCSTDGSREVVEECRRADSRVVSVLHDVNRGLARARNTGFAASSGTFVALCDADDVWLPDKLKIQMEYFEREPNTGLVHSDSLIIDKDGNPTGERFSALFHGKHQKTAGSLFEALCLRNFLCVPTVTMRRQAFIYAGGFPEGLRSLEDWVCWTKISRKYLVSYIDDPLVQYRVHGSGLSNNQRNMARNRVTALRLLMEEYSDISAKTRAKMLYSLGMSYMEIDESQDAIKAFGKSIEANPAEFRSWVRCCQSIGKQSLRW